MRACVRVCVRKVTEVLKLLYKNKIFVAKVSVYSPLHSKVDTDRGSLGLRLHGLGSFQILAFTILFSPYRKMKLG